MTNEEIEKFRNKYDSLKDTKKYILDLQSKIKEYEKENPVVRKYLALKEQLEVDKEYSYWGVQDLDEEQMLERAIKETKINETNNIYVYISSYVGVNQLNNKNKKDALSIADIPVFYDNPDVDYRKYRNIELSPGDDNYEVNVPIFECEKFESDNIVLYSHARSGSEYYEIVRRVYFDEIYTFGEQKALEKVMYKRNCQKGLKRK